MIFSIFVFTKSAFFGIICVYSKEDRLIQGINGGDSFVYSSRFRRGNHKVRDESMLSQCTTLLLTNRMSLKIR